VGLIDSLTNQTLSIYDMLSSLNHMAENLLKTMNKINRVKSKDANHKDSVNNNNIKESKELSGAKELTKTLGKSNNDSGMAELNFGDNNNNNNNNNNTGEEEEALTLTGTSKQTEASVEDQVTLATEISSICNLVKKQIDRHRKMIRSLHQNEQDSAAMDTDESTLNLEQRYRRTLKQHQFGECSMLDAKSGNYVHHYQSRITAEGLTAKASANKLKRLVQEVGSLSNCLPLYVDSSVFLRVDEERIDVMKCLITGPEGTPYDNGCFEFHIYCPPEYPVQPPLVNLETTGGGSVRFNPNLYNCGKVCLSLLGTWSGGTNERWNEKTSTLLQLMVSIQSLIFVEQPYFNEPGYEVDMDTPHGKQENMQYNEVIRVATIRWAMTEQLRNPSPGFEDVIKTHFKLKQDVIIKQIRGWLKDAQVTKRSAHYSKLKKTFDEFKEELIKLDPESKKKFETGEEKEEEIKEGKKEEETETAPAASVVPKKAPKVAKKKKEKPPGKKVDTNLGFDLFD
jgi:ubiquitin-protein ligase